jgi:tRNA dimethylallyltransferase
MTAHDSIVVILGPTAGGKSDLAVEVATACDGEIINADSMQVYRQLNAGTAKPTTEQRHAVVHHLIDCVDPTEAWTVADWLGATENLIEQIHAQGRRVVVVGGTNLYIKALLEGMFDGPPTDEAFRTTLNDVDTADLHQRLRPIDADAAERIHPNDRKRIVRALEVYHATGQPISELQKQWTNGSQGDSVSYRYNPLLIGLSWPVEQINQRINARVKAMFDPLDGSEDLLSETQRLEAAGQLGEQARQALGTKQVLDHLEGRFSLGDAMEQVKIVTRRFAKSQRTWLRRYRTVSWLEAVNLTAPERTPEALEIVGKWVQNTPPSQSPQ